MPPPALGTDLRWGSLDGQDLWNPGEPATSRDPRPMSVKRRSIRVVLLTAVVAVLTACAESPDDSLPPASVTTLEEGGITVVESSRPSWPAAGWTVEPEPTLVIHGDDPHGRYQLFGVVGVWRFRGGRIAVANQSTREVLLFDPLGEFQGAFGGPGDGPGEFPYFFNGVFGCDGDGETLVIDDSRRVSFFDEVGTFLRSQRHALYLQARIRPILGIAPDCSALLLHEITTADLSSTRRALQYTLFWAPLDGAAHDTVSVFFGAEVASAGEAYAPDLIVPFSPHPVWASRGDTVYLGTADEFEIDVFVRGRGLARTQRWHAEPTPVNREARRLYETYRRLAIEQAPDSRRVLPPISEFTLPESQPAYSAMLLDDEANLWVQVGPVSTSGYEPLVDWLTREGLGPEPEPQEWLVFDPEGRMMGRVEAPRGLRVHRVQGGEVIGIVLDDQGIENVQFHRVEKTTTGGA